MTLKHRTILLCACALTLASVLPAADLTASLEDVALLAQSDVSVETILAFLDSRELAFALDAEQIAWLSEAGVSDEVIRYLVERTGVVPEVAYPAPQAYAPYPPNYYAADYLYPPSYYAGYYGFGYPTYGFGGSLHFGASIFPHRWYDFHYSGFSHSRYYGHADGVGSLGHRPTGGYGHAGGGSRSHLVSGGNGAHVSTGGHARARSGYTSHVGTGYSPGRSTTGAHRVGSSHAGSGASRSSQGHAGRGGSVGRHASGARSRGGHSGSGGGHARGGRSGGGHSGGGHSGGGHSGGGRGH